MSSERTIPAGETRNPAFSAHYARRLAALVEVVVAFALVHVAYRSFKHFTEPGRWESAAGLNFSPGAVMILFTAVVLWLCRRDFAAYGLNCRDWGFSLTLGVFWAVVLLGAAGLVIWLTPVHFDPLTPPDRTRALAAAAGELAATFLLLLSLREGSVLRRVPPAVSLCLLLGLLATPLVLAAAFDRPVRPVLLTSLWLFFGAGCGEEIFFRGYIQSRVNQGFGRPFRLWGVDFGWGLIVSALLFGFIHVLNPVDYFAGRFAFAWWWMLPNFTAGLFLGLLREKTGSILAGAVLHGLMDVLERVPSLLP